MAKGETNMTPEFALEYRKLMLANVENESKTARRVIAAVPDGESAYRPDPKAFNAFDLAWHIAMAETNLLNCVANCQFAPPPKDVVKPTTIKGILDWHEAKFNSAVSRVKAMSNDQLIQPVEFFGAITAPAVSFLYFVAAHTIHHRGQLSMYLRPMGSKVPSIYGPSADEQWQPPKPAAAAAKA